MPRTDAFSDYRTMKEAARFLGVKRTSVQMAVARGRLLAIRRGGVLWVHKDDLRTYYRTRKFASHYPPLPEEDAAAS